MAIPYRFSLRDPVLRHALLCEYAVPLHKLDSRDPVEREEAQEMLNVALVRIGNGLSRDGSRRLTVAARSKRLAAQRTQRGQRLAAVIATLADLPRGQHMRRELIRREVNKRLPSAIQFENEAGGSFKRCLEEARKILRRR